MVPSLVGFPIFRLKERKRRVALTADLCRELCTQTLGVHDGWIWFESGSQTMPSQRITIGTDVFLGRAVSGLTGNAIFGYLRIYADYTVTMSPFTRAALRGVALDAVLVPLTLAKPQFLIRGYQET